MSNPLPPSAADRVGVVASTLCAVHCLAAALLPAALAALGLSSLLTHEAEWAFTLLAAGVAGVALLSAFRRGGSPSVLALLGAGITGLIAARFLEEAGAEGLGVTVAFVSGFALVLGHLQNLRTPLRQPCCAPE